MHLTQAEAHEKLKGTDSAQKHELLFAKLGTNYNNEKEIFRKGTVIVNCAVSLGQNPAEETINDSLVDKEK